MTRVLRSTHVRLVATVLVAALALTALIGRDDQAGAVGSDVDVVYVADGRSFADALVGSVLAAMNNAPLLTVEGARHRDEIPDATFDELNRLKPIEKIRVFGGTAAISDDVLNRLSAFTTGGDAARIAGTTRFGTAAAIAQALPEKVKNADQLDGNDGTHYLDRANHTGTQPPGTIDPQGDGSGLDADNLDGLDATAFARAPETQTGRYRCTGDDFVETFGDGLFVRENDLALTSSDDEAIYRCPLHLPDGATITAFRFDARDDDDASNVASIRLVGRDVTETDTGGTIASVSDTGMADTHGEHFVQEDASPNDTAATTVNDTYGYTVRFLVDSTNSTRVGVNWAEVEYEVDSVPGTTAP